MELETREDGGVLIGTLRERRLDARSAPALKAALATLVQGGHTRLALDLSAVEFVDSSGLGALVSTLKALAGSGDLVVCGARETVVSMFKLTRLDKVFLLVPSVPEAVAALNR